MRIAVLGAGNGGLAAAADLTLRGHEVRLFEHPAFRERLLPIREEGGIELTGIRSGFASPALITEDICSAVRNADLIQIVVPAFGQRPMAELLAPYVAPHQPILLNPGSTGGSVEVARILRAAGHRGPVGETTMLTYVCRAVGPATVLLSHIPRRLHVAAFPARDTENLLRPVRELYPFLEPAVDILETSLNNINPIIHLGTALCNAGWIESSGGQFYFFREGFTSSVARIHEAMDAERVHLQVAFGYPTLTALDYMKMIGYTESSNNWEEAIRTSHVFCGSFAFKAPRSLADRFFTEDAGYNIVTWLELAEVAGVRMPVTEAVCRLVSVLHGVDYRTKAYRGLRVLGFEGLTVEELRRVVLGQ